MKEFYFQLGLTVFVVIILILTKVPLLMGAILTAINLFIDYKTYKRVKELDNEK